MDLPTFGFSSITYQEIMDELHEILVDHLNETNDPFLTLQWKTDGETKYGYYDALNYAKTQNVLSTIDLSQTINTEGIVYPNPAKNILYINHDRIKNIDLLDNTGKTLTSFGAVDSLDISSIQPGLFLLRISTLENEVLTVRLIK